MINDYMFFTCITLAFVLTGVTRASNIPWSSCHGDICFSEQEQFCSDVYKMCRPCFEVLDHCFTPDMPQNCTQTCLNDKLKEAHEKPCEGFKEIEHGKHNGSQSVTQEQGMSILFSCEDGYRLIGHDLLHCKPYGQWSSPPPICKEITCPVLSSMSNGKHNGSSKQLAPGTVVTTSCDDGTKLYGKNITTCSYSGQWTNNLPICEPISCTQPPAIRNGKWLPLHQSTQQFAHGYILHAGCNTGFSIDSSAVWTCHGGVWQRNDSYVPTCFKQGESLNNTLIIIAILFGVLLLVSITGNCLQCYVKRRYIKEFQNDPELGQQAGKLPKDISQSQEGIQNSPENKRKPDESHKVFSLHGNDNVKPVDKVVLDSADTLPQPNTIDNQTKDNTIEPGQNFVLYVNNVIKTNITNPGPVNTSDRNVGDKKTSSTSDTNEKPQPSHYNDKPPVEETGNPSQPESPDAFVSTVPKKQEETEMIRMQPEDLLNNGMLTRPDSQNNIESLNLEPIGATEPISKNSDNSSSLMMPQTVIGTQPLKPDDGYRSRQENDNAASPRPTRLSDESADCESDGGDETSSLLSSSQSSLQTVDHNQGSSLNTNVNSL